MSRPILTISWVLSALLAAGCAEPQTPPSRNGEWLGYAAIADDRLLPIRADIRIDAPSPSGYFVVGDEKTPIPQISIWDDSMRFEFSEYGAAMIGRLEADRFSGSYLRFREDTTSFPFVLFWNQPETTPDAPDPSVAGTYRASFGGGDNVDASSIATISIDGKRLTGTVIHPSGDYGLLEGIQTDGMIQLYRFTGWQALYFELMETAVGYRGRFQIRDEPASEVVLVRTDETAREVDRITRMKDPEAQFLFSGLTSDGLILTSQDSQFVGRPMVIDIMGTWCHNCLDAAPLLQEAAEAYADTGLQVVSLSFEVSSDAVAGLKNIELFKERFGITYPILYCGSLDDANIAARLGTQLDDFFSYPTTIFINRSGKVVDVQTGFNGPGTGSRWEEQKTEFNRAISSIVGT